MTLGWNKILGISVPLLVAALASLASMIPVILQRKERMYIMGKEVLSVHPEAEMECTQDGAQSGFSIVGSVYSNNHSPHLAMTLLEMLDRVSNLGIELNLNLRGCATIG